MQQKVYTEAPKNVENSQRKEKRRKKQKVVARPPKKSFILIIPVLLGALFLLLFIHIYRLETKIAALENTLEKTNDNIASLLRMFEEGKNTCTS